MTPHSTRRARCVPRCTPGLVTLLATLVLPPLAAATLSFESGYSEGTVVGQPLGAGATWSRFTANVEADRSLVIGRAPGPRGRLLRASNTGASGGFRLPLDASAYLAGGGYTFDGQQAYVRYGFQLAFESVHPTANGNGVGLVRLGDNAAQTFSLELLADGRLRYQTWDAAAGTLRNLFVKASEAGTTDFIAQAGQPIAVEGIVDYAAKHYTLVVNGVPQRAFLPADRWRITFRSPAATDNDLIVNTQNVGQAFFQAWTLDDIVLTAEPVPAAAKYLENVTINVVTAYGADPTGVTDSTAALQRAISENIDRPAGVRTLYLPNGTYRISDTLQWYNLAGRNAAYLTLQGESRDGVVLQLTDHHPLFQNAAPATPPERKAVIHVRSDDNPAWYSNPANPFGEAVGEGHLAFHNNLLNLTIDTGTGNPGAVGIDYHASNQGLVRDVVIRSGDGAGLIGLALDRKNTGPGLMTGVRISGFATGLSARSQYALTLEHVHLQHQTVAGLSNAGHTLAIRGLRSTNTVPAIVSTAADGTIVLLDSELAGGAATTPAIDLIAGRLYARNVLASGYASALRQDGVALTGSFLRDYSSDGVASLVPGATGSLRLPIEETPRPPALPPTAYAVVTAFGALPDDGVDDTAALQAALEAGQPGVLFAAGTYTLTQPLVVPGHVRHMDFNWSNLQVVAGQHFPPRGPAPAAIQVAASSDHPLILEKFQLRGSGFDLVASGVSHTSRRPLVIQHALLPSFLNGPDAGPLFLADVSSHENGESFAFEYPQQVWIRQFNPESYYHPKAINNGGTLWILGMKTERASTALRTLGGGRTELLGGVFYQNHDAPVDLPLFRSIEADHALTFNTTTDFQGRPFEVVVAESRQGATTELLRPAAAPRGAGVNGVGYGLFSGATGLATPPAGPPQIRLERVTPTLREGTSAVALRLRRLGDKAGALTIPLVTTGTATAGVDFTAPASVEMPDGAHTVDFVVTTLDDATLEPAETLQVSLAPGAGYVPGYPAEAVVTVLDNDQPLVTGVPTTQQILWFRADGDLALEADGRVSTWYDHSPAGNHASLSAAERTPRWLAAGTATAPAPALHFHDSLLFLPKSESLQSAGPYPGRSYYLAFRTGSDVTSRQMIYEQGGSGRGLTIYVHNGAVTVCVYNRLQITALWNEVFRSGTVQPDTSYVLEFHLDGLLHTLGARLNRRDLGTVSIPGLNGGVLDSHGDLTVFGGVTESARFHDLDVPRRLGGYYFRGLVYEMIGYNGVLDATARESVGSYLTDKYLGPPPPPNAPPRVVATTPSDRPVYLSGPLPLQLAVAVDATDDGEPAGSSLTYQWSATRAPLTVFGNPAAASTTATFSTRGFHRFHCVVSDGERSVAHSFLVVVQ